jgi:hypothetical protein
MAQLVYVLRERGLECTTERFTLVYAKTKSFVSRSRNKQVVAHFFTNDIEAITL